MKQGFIIPVYRHCGTVGQLIKKLICFNIPVIIIDDGNSPSDKAFLKNLTAENTQTVLVSLKKNIGKGGALAHGFEKAVELGLTHVFQIDADGQHDLETAAFFLEESAKHPEKIICGYPVFDKSAPGSRVTGRKISNLWGAIVTLSDELKDVLCGYRVYPVQESLRITRDPFMDKRMGFDTEILVRLYWNGVFPVFHDVRINYPQNGFSNFRMIKDNLHISWMFSRLFIGMLIRLPMLIVLKLKRGKKKYEKR
ncbi:MAG: glycosyltransferase family 2 protein [Treponema sp.]|nr:glycosyltransferase family 2 protein [Treponema sp.]